MRNQIIVSMIRYFGMHAPLQGMRIAMYRKVGVKIGEPFTFGSNIFIDVGREDGDVKIGDHVIMAGYDHILTHSSILWGIKVEGGPVVIENGARIGFNVTILPGVTIGENAAIGACSLVNKDIPANCIAVGVPAKPIKWHHFRDHQRCWNFPRSELIEQLDPVE